MKLNGFFVSFAFAIVGMAVASEPIKLGSSRFVTEAARAVGQQTGVAEEELHARAGFKDDLGQVHVRFDRYHRCVPVNGGDVAGHEMTHGVTSNTAGLVYYGESGGLNESTSDIFGTMVEFHANNSEDTPDYLIGEMVDFGINGEYLGFLRNMEDPRADGRSIDNYRDYHVGINVHYSSGIANNFYYLLANGGTNPSSGNTVPSGIGRVDAARIWYRALTVYMTSRTGFREARVACLRAAADLFGATSTQLRITDQAWNAVGVGAL